MRGTPLHRGVPMRPCGPWEVSSTSAKMRTERRSGQPGSPMHSSTERCAAADRFLLASRADSPTKTNPLKTPTRTLRMEPAYHQVMRHIRHTADFLATVGWRALTFQRAHGTMGSLAITQSTVGRNHLVG